MSDKLTRDLAHVINCNSAENGSNTPDFILAEYLAGCLRAFDKAVTAREKWFGREAENKRLREALRGLYETGAPDGLALTADEIQLRFDSARAAIARAEGGR